MPPTLYLVPYVVSAVTSLWITLYAWQRRQMIGAFALAVCGFSQAFNTTAYIFELVASDLGDKIFWDKIQWIGPFTGAVGYYICVRSWVKRSSDQDARLWAKLNLFTVIFWVLVITDPWHGWLYPNPRLIEVPPFNALTYDPSLPYYAGALYVFILITLSINTLFRQVIQLPQPYSNQAGWMFIGLLVPYIAIITGILGIRVAGQRDISPFTFLVSNVAIFWGLFYYHLLDLVPIAYDTVAENMSDGVLVFDNQLRVVNINPAASRMLGKSAAQVIGLTASHALQPWLSWQFELGQEIAHHEHFSAETGRHYDLSFTPLHNQRQQLLGALLVLRDVTAPKALQTQTLRAERLQQEQELDRLKLQFIEITSHEFRTQLAIMLASADLLEHYWDKMPQDKRQGHLDKLQVSIAELKHLLDDIYVVNDVSFFEPQPQPFALKAACQSVLSHFERPINLVAPEVTILQDQAKLTGILVQLLSNAVKFSPPNTPIELEITLHAETVQLAVTDYGIGIPPQERDSIFEAYRRASNVNARRGLGLGLALAKKMATAMRGSLRLESTGQGTTFLLEFPRTLLQPAIDSTPAIHNHEDSIQS